MPKYRATLQVSGIRGENPHAVRSALDDQLRKSGFENCHVVRIDLDVPPPNPSNRSYGGPGRDEVDTAWRQRSNTGGLLLAAAAAWAIWFFWWMLSGPGE